MRRTTTTLAAMLTAPLLALAAQAGPTTATLKSGLEVGQSLQIFNPRHVAGPDKGTNACPI